MKQVRLLFTCILWSIFVLACSADYDTFGTSDYHKMNEIHFEEEASNPSVYQSEQKLVVTLEEGLDSLDPSDLYVTISSIDISSMASIHLVNTKFKNYPTDSLALDSLAYEVGYDEEPLKVGDKIKIPVSLVKYIMIVAESGDRAIWQIQFVIPGVEPSSSSSESSDTEESSSSEGSDSENLSSSSGEAKKSDTSFEIFFENSIETNTSGDTISVLFPLGTNLSEIKLESFKLGRNATILEEPESIKDWTKPISFTVKAEDGTEKVWVVIVEKVKSSETSVMFFFKNQVRISQSGDTISISLEYGNVVNETVLDSIKLSEGATIIPSLESVQTWKESQVFTVKAEDGTTRDVVLLLSIAEKDFVASTEKELLEISAENELSSATIDKGTKTVTLHLANESALQQVKVTIKVSDKASENLADVLDLRSSRTFIITAEDGSQDSWTLKADYPKSSLAEIESFETEDFEAINLNIDKSNRTISFEIPNDFADDANMVFFKVTTSSGAKIVSPADGYLDLSSGSAGIKVKAEDGTEVTWTVNASIQAELPEIKEIKIGNGNVKGVINASTGFILFNMDMGTDLDLRNVKVQSLTLSNGASTEDISVNSSYDFARQKTVIVKNEKGDKKIYTLQAGYQYTNYQFNSWSGNDVSGWANGNGATSTAGVTVTNSDYSNQVVKMESKDAKIMGMGKFASGNMLVAYFNPKDVGVLKMAGYEDGNELIDFGRPFYGRPTYVEFDAKYDGNGDSCDLYVFLEHRSSTTNEGRNQYRTSSDVNTLVASAWFRATSVEDKSDPDVISITNASRDGFKTIRLKFKYGEPYTESPIYNSSAFNTTLKESAGIDNHVVKTNTPDNFDVTHIRIAMASSSLGNEYKGSVGATLWVDEVRLIYGE